MQLPEDYMPDWAKYILATVLGAGGVHWFRAFLENRRLAKKDFRELLLDRVRELEKAIASMQVRMGNLRVEMAHLETENRQLRRELGVCEDQSHADEQPDRGDDDDQPA